MARRPLRPDEKPAPKVDPTKVTYPPAGGAATYRGKPLTTEEVKDADHRTP